MVCCGVLSVPLIERYDKIKPIVNSFLREYIVRKEALREQIREVYSGGVMGYVILWGIVECLFILLLSYALLSSQ